MESRIIILRFTTFRERQWSAVDFTVEDAWNGKGSEEAEEKRAQLFFGRKRAAVSTEGGQKQPWLGLRVLFPPNDTTSTFLRIARRSVEEYNCTM